MNPVICFIPCCNRKRPSPRNIEPIVALSKNELPVKWHMLDNGRQRVRVLAAKGAKNIHFASNSTTTSALNLYTGGFYKELSTQTLISAIQAGKLRLFILSAGYGIVDAFEPLQNYNIEMKGQVAKLWRDYDLGGIISELLLTLRPKSVYGFFAGDEAWSCPGAKYRYFFTEGSGRALKDGLDVGLSGCFFRSAGLGTTAILGSLGRLFMDLVQSEFDESLVSEIEANSRIDGTTVLSFKRIYR